MSSPLEALEELADDPIGESPEAPEASGVPDDESTSEDKATGGEPSEGELTDTKTSIDPAEHERTRQELEWYRKNQQVQQIRQEEAAKIAEQRRAEEEHAQRTEEINRFYQQQYEALAARINTDDPVKFIAGMDRLSRQREAALREEMTEYVPRAIQEGINIALERIAATHQEEQGFVREFPEFDHPEVRRTVMRMRQAGFERAEIARFLDSVMGAARGGKAPGAGVNPRNIERQVARATQTETPNAIGRGGPEPKDPKQEARFNADVDRLLEEIL